MSGYPSMDRIKVLRNTFREWRELDEGQRVLRDKIIEEKAQLQKLVERKAEAERRVKKLMDEMDVSSPGNYGYENRLFSLLLGLSEDCSNCSRFRDKPEKPDV